MALTDQQKRDAYDPKELTMGHKRAGVWSICTGLFAVVFLIFKYDALSVDWLTLSSIGIAIIGLELEARWRRKDMEANISRRLDNIEGFLKYGNVGGKRGRNRWFQA